MRRREYIRQAGPDAILYDYFIPRLGITIARFAGWRWGARVDWLKRAIVDVGPWGFLFWGFAVPAEDR